MKSWGELIFKYFFLCWETSIYLKEIMRSHLKCGRAIPWPHFPVLAAWHCGRQWRLLKDEVNNLTQVPDFYQGPDSCSPYYHTALPCILRKREGGVIVGAINLGTPVGIWTSWVKQDVLVWGRREGGALNTRGSACLRFTRHACALTSTMSEFVRLSCGSLYSVYLSSTLSMSVLAYWNSLLVLLKMIDPTCTMQLRVRMPH